MNKNSVVRRFIIAAILILVVAGNTACSYGGSLFGISNSQPGEGVSVRMARATWDTGWFQAEVFKALLEELGYEVREPIETLENLPAYFFIAQGDLDFWANGWFPLHDRYLRYGEVNERVITVGYQLKNGALQGYMTDKATADRLGITNLGDLKEPEIAAVFDHDGDGKAELTGCNVGWACEGIIQHQLAAFRLEETVTQVQGDYSELMQETLERYESGEAVLFYTWTPNWTVSRMVIGEDVVWLSVPFSTQPDKASVDTAVDSLHGCLETPCDLGFESNDIRVAANTDFLDLNPAAAKLFELVEFPLNDIATQNVLLADGENTDEEIRGHASAWIDANRSLVDSWLEAARAAAE